MKGQPATVRVFIIDANPAVRKGLAALLNRHPQIEVVGAAADLDAGLPAARRADVDVLLVEHPVRGRASGELKLDASGRPIVIGLGHATPGESHGFDRVVDKTLATGALVDAVLTSMTAAAP